MSFWFVVCFLLNFVALGTCSVQGVSFPGKMLFLMMRWLGEVKCVL